MERMVVNRRLNLLFVTICIIFQTFRARSFLFFFFFFTKLVFYRSVRWVVWSMMYTLYTGMSTISSQTVELISIICFLGFFFFSPMSCTGAQCPISNNVFFKVQFVWFGMVTVLSTVWLLSLLLCPFHKKLRIWKKKSFSFCQTDDPPFSFMFYYTNWQLIVEIWK